MKKNTYENANIISVRGFTPQVGSDVFIAPNATLVGDVNIGARCSIWYNVTIRGDVEPILIGEECNIQDGAIVHGTYHKANSTLERRVSIGHGVILHGCSIGEASLIGMGSIVMDNAVIPKHCLVGAGSLVTEGARFEEGWLIIGRPAKAVRQLSPEEIILVEKSADNYLMYTTWYK